MFSKKNHAEKPRQVKRTRRKMLIIEVEIKEERMADQITVEETIKI